MPFAFTTAELATILVPATALVTLMLTKGVDALLKLRADGRTDKIRIEAGIDAGLKLVIERQDERIRTLERLVDLREHDHDECLKAYNTLKEAFLTIKYRLEAMERREKRRADGEAPGSDSDMSMDENPTP